jgi:Protein of unknown function (DUF1566)
MLFNYPFSGMKVIMNTQNLIVQNTVVIVVEGGVVTYATSNIPGVRVIVHDKDCIDSADECEHERVLDRVATGCVDCGFTMSEDVAVEVGASTVTDPKTGLQWKCYDEGRYTYDDAVKRFVGKDDFAGHSDWRMPTVDELKTLLKADGDITDQLQDHEEAFWSSSPYVGYANGAWYVNFYDGSVGGGNRGNALYVRLVRAGQ